MPFKKKCLPKVICRQAHAVAPTVDEFNRGIPGRVPRKRSGVLSLREIRRFQRSTEYLIPKAPFVDLVREIVQCLGFDVRVRSDAYMALQAACEAYIVEMFQLTVKLTAHAKRVTINLEDLKLAMDIMNGNFSAKPTPEARGYFLECSYKEQ